MNLESYYRGDTSDCKIYDKTLCWNPLDIADIASSTMASAEVQRKLSKIKMFEEVIADRW